jgi:hypothetical protein
MSGDDEATAGDISHIAVNKGGLSALMAGQSGIKTRGPAPVHLWNPPYCGEIDIRIAADGTWYHEGARIGRMPLVKLFASILRRDPERHVLVTPAECVGIVVEDAPFLAVEMRVEGKDAAQVLHLRTNVDDWVRVDGDHPLSFAEDAHGGLKPYVLVRGGLLARLTRALTHDLAELAEEREGRWFVQSAGAAFALEAAPAR